jgi:hypothetical protein
MCLASQVREKDPERISTFDNENERHDEHVFLFSFVST